MRVKIVSGLSVFYLSSTEKQGDIWKAYGEGIVPGNSQWKPGNRSVGSIDFFKKYIRCFKNFDGGKRHLIKVLVITIKIP
jgi:hypothetical protein